MTKTTRALVTGGAGFIGSHLVERLLQDGNEVIVLDNFRTGKRENLQAVENHPNLTLQEVDITEFEKIEACFQGVSWVFHLAALADIVPSIVEPLKYHQTNVDGTIAVLEAARAAEVKRFLYAASSSCYGIPDTYPTSETAQIRPMYPYALTKYLGEQYVLHWHKVYKLPSTSLRLFNVYGRRARSSGTYGAVFGVFLKQKIAGKPFTVVGEGTQTRDSTFVSDVVQAFIDAAQTDGIQGEIFNVGSGNTYSVNHLVELLEGDVVFLPKRPGEPDCTFADTTKIKTRIGWKPVIPFEQGVAKMLESIDDWREAPLWDPDNITEATKEWFRYLSD